MHLNDRIALTVEDAIAVTGYSRNRLYDAMNDGSLRSFKDGRRRMISRKALEDFIAKREAASMKGAA